MSSELAIAVRSISKNYRIYEKPEHRLIQMATLGRMRPFKEFAALHNISFDMYRGETIGIVGRNGCGKSTLLQIICGTLQPSEGSVEVRGRVAALLELGAGFNGEFTGRENVYMNGAILGLSRDEMDAKFEDIARFASIGDFIERPVKTYSSGMFVRLAFAVATAVEPDILVVDEALAVGDEAFQRKCFARIEAIKERGGTILFVSHSAGTVVQLCDRAVLLDAGEKIMSGEPKLVVGQYQRLINSTGETAALVRAEIAAMTDFGVPSAANAIGALPNVSGSPAPASDRESIDLFDAHLVSESRISYESKGAIITDVAILNARDEVCNVIGLGRRYTLTYRVDFANAAQKVAFGFLVTTPNGVDVAGAGTSFDERLLLESVALGGSVDVAFEFQCDFMPGAYFVTVGCSGLVDGERTYLHRMADAYPFKVMPEPHLISTGFFDLRVNPVIKRRDPAIV